MGKKALVTGIRGQDGAYLSRLLLDKGYEVYGADRRSGGSLNWRMKELNIEKDVEVLYMDLLELTNIIQTIKKIQPDEIYNLAAQSFVRESFNQPVITSDTNALGALRILEVLRTTKPDTKFYQASTSEMFGKARYSPQNEDTPFYPRSPYAVSKLFGHWITVNYRESFGLFACSGILFNHESPLRGPEFVSRKITKGVAEIKKGIRKKITMGNIDSKRDWGYAKEYVEAIWLMMQQDKPDDFVIATGETHSIREFLELAFQYIGVQLEWLGKGVDEKAINKKTGETVIDISKELFRPSEVDEVLGDCSKARRALGWSPRIKFRELVKLMVEYDCANT